MPSYEQLIKEAARKYGLPPDYLSKLIQYESRGNPRAVSPTGASGLTQFTKGTAKQYGLKDRFDPAQNIDAAARLALDNKRAISKALGREPTSSELYLGHLQGAGGASKGFRNPSGRAVDVFGRQAVAVNLPKSARGQTDTITAKQFQDLHQGNFNRTKGGTVDIGATPTLEKLSPSKPMMINTSTGNLPLSQLAPTEGDNNMARHKYPGYNDAIRSSLTGNTENVEAAPTSFIPPDTDLKGRTKIAGMVPPGLTKGAATTRDAANKNVQPRGTVHDADAAKKRSDEIKSVPDAGEQISGKKGGSTPDQQKALADWNEAHEKWLNGDGPNPGPPPTIKPNVRSATDPAGAADPRTGTSLQVYDPNLAAQNDPARQALIASKIRGTARPGGQPPQLPPPGKGGDITGPTAAAGAGAVVAGTMAGTQRPDAKPPADTLTIEHLIAQGIPTIKEAMKNPQTAGAVKTAVKGLITTRAAQDAQQADVVKDPTYYQRMASQRTPSGSPADPSDPMYERRMMDAVVRDNQGVMSRRGQPQQDPALAAVQQRIQQGPPPEVPRPRGTISIRPTPDSVRNAQPVYPQPAPGEEKGGPPPAAVMAQRPPYPTAPQAGPSPHRFQQYADAPSSQGLPTGYQAPAESIVNYPLTNGPAPQMNAQMMDPTMMQLMQFFTQGGGGGAGNGP